MTDKFLCRLRLIILILIVLVPSAECFVPKHRIHHALRPMQPLDISSPDSMQSSSRCRLHALPRKPRADDEVVRIAKDEKRVLTGGDFKVNKVHAAYILENMPAYSFGDNARRRMKALHREAIQVLEQSEEEEQEDKNAYENDDAV